MRGVVVLGPEDSGTGYVRDLIVAAGARLIDPWVQRDFDDQPPVIKASLPNGAEWPTLDKLLGLIDVDDPFVVLTSRRWDVLGTAQVKTGHTDSTSETIANAQRAYVFALSEIARFHVPFVLTSYESFADRTYREYVASMALPNITLREYDAAGGYEFLDANAKHLTGGPDE